MSKEVDYLNYLDRFLVKSSVIVMPTDTVYGLVARVSDESAVDRLYKLKNREAKPGTVIAASIQQLIDLGLKARYLKAVSSFWPGPVSVVIPTSNDNLRYLTQGLPDIAVRVVDSPRLVDLLKQTGPLLTSSANLANLPSANNIDEARRYFNDQVDLYIDGGDLANQRPSTIIKIVDDEIVVIRSGAAKVK